VLVANADQANNEGDSLGDVCDPDDDNDGVADATDNCPLVPNTSQTDANGDGRGDACDPDNDSDGVPNSSDLCPNTSAGAKVDKHGCSVSQLCPCAGPRGTTAPWRNHGGYVVCVTSASLGFFRANLITLQNAVELIVQGAIGSCGRH
jgi:hypothetical protein